MKHHLRIFRQILANSATRQIAYRTNHAILTLSNILLLALIIVTAEVIYQNTTSIAGWSKGEVILLALVWDLIYECFNLFCGESHSGFANHVVDGAFDRFLILPASPWFLANFLIVRLEALYRILSNLVILVVVISLYDLQVSASMVGIFLLMLPAAVAVQFSVSLMANVLSFWLGRISNVNYFLQETSQLIRYPLVILPKFLYVVLLTAFPIAVINYIPVSVALGHEPLWWIGGAYGIAVIFLVLSRSFFYFALRSYSSASS